MIYNEGKCDIYLMGDFNIDLLKYENCTYSQALLHCTQSFSMLPVIDKPTRVYGTSATLIDNIFTNNLENSIVGVSIWNSIPLSLKSLNKSAYQNKIKKLLLDVLNCEDDYIEVSKLIKHFATLT